MSEKQQQLVLSVIEFLKHSLDDGTVKQDDKEGLEVAIQCIGEAFGVDPSDKEQCDHLSVKPATLQSIFDVFLKTRDRVGSGSRAVPTAPAPSIPSEQDTARAEKLKQTGNARMSSKQYDQAIDSYTQAIAIDPANPVYYSNRAAAHASKGDHLSAVGDAEKAISIDPSFVKAYHRLGHAQYSIGDYNAAASAFRRGLEKDPTNASLRTGAQNAEARIHSDQDTPDATTTPSTAPSPGMADMLGNMGGGAGGMPDIASLMNNPMMMQMAQQMMANGGLDNLMQNPSVANMMNRVQSGGGMPTMDEIMGDPTLRNLASQFGAGGSH